MSRRLVWTALVVCVCTVGVAVIAAQTPPFWPLFSSGQPMRQTAYLKASNPGMFDHFGEGGALDGHIGNAVAVSGDGNTIAVGAQHESSNARGINGNQNNDSAYNAGAVYVFTRNGGDWTQQAYVKASNAGNGDHFGNVVALSADGNTMAVGAFWESGGATGVNGNQDDNSIPQAGAVYVFTRRGAHLDAAGVHQGIEHGQCRAKATFRAKGISSASRWRSATTAIRSRSARRAKTATPPGSTATRRTSRALTAGAVYVYARSGTTWAQQAYIKSEAPPMGAAGDQFGYSVALNANGNTLGSRRVRRGRIRQSVNAPIDAMRERVGRRVRLRARGRDVDARRRT